MGTLLTILGVLFLTLIIIVPLIERFGPRYTAEESGKLSRFIFPLLAILIVVQLIFYFFFTP